MSNDPLFQFNRVCKKLGIKDKRQQRRFHEYLNSTEYEQISDNFSFSQLLEIGKEFLEFDGGLK